MSRELTGVDRPFNAAVLQEPAESAVSWAAIISGAVTALAITMILLWLGASLGLASLSPWPNMGASAKSFAITTAVGLIIVQWVAALFGGYVTGRLRTKWTAVHSHEVFFRDPAHGFLSWSLTMLVGSIVFATASSSVIGGASHAAATVASGAMQAAGSVTRTSQSPVPAYDVESLFRSDHPDPATQSAFNAQVTHILESAITNGGLSPSDHTYLVQLIASRTGVAPAEAQIRVDSVIAREKAVEVKAREAADAARKAAADFAMFTALSMLIGAFISSAAAAYGGSLRDEHAASMYPAE